MATEVFSKVFIGRDGPPNYRKRHKTTWMEWELPPSVKKEVERFAAKKLNQFLEKCKCAYCKNRRGEIVHNSIKTK